MFHLRCRNLTCLKRRAGAITEGLIRGICSAGATIFFDRPTTIASLLYPFLFIQLSFGVTMGPIRMNGSQPLINLIAQGMIPTDGSEERVAVGQDAVKGSFYVNPRAESAMSDYIHDDFQALQDGRKATQERRPIFRLRKSEPPE
jgi:hypothetical protein